MIHERRGVLIDEGIVETDMLTNGVRIRVTNPAGASRSVDLGLSEARVFLDQLTRMIELVEINNRLNEE